MWNEGTVHVVDDDKFMRESIAALVHSMEIEVSMFGSCEEFLAEYSPGTMGCLVTDVRLLGMSGLDLQERLHEVDSYLPVVVMTAYAKTALTVRAMRAGAVTVLDKPIDQNALWSAIQEALKRSCREREKRIRNQMLRDRRAQLTPDEEAVFALIVDGEPNRAIALRLHIGIRTVESRRRSVFRKMRAESLAELLQMAFELREPEL